MTAASPVDPAATVEIAAVIRTVATEAIRDALYQVAAGASLTVDEETLIEMYRRAGEQHRTAALRTLERGQPAERHD